MSTFIIQQNQQLEQKHTISRNMQKLLQVLKFSTLELRSIIHRELNSNPFLEEKFRSRHIQNEDLSSDERNIKTSLRAQANRQGHTIKDITLYDHLFNQVSSISSSICIKRALHYLICSLDPSGFLTSFPKDISLESSIPIKTISDSIYQLKKFHPTGVGCLNIKECLIEQLKKKNAFGLTSTIINSHYDLLLNRRFHKIASRTNTSLKNVKSAIKQISNLVLTPGSMFSPSQNSVIKPDLIIEKDHRQLWTISHYNNSLPEVYINEEYKKILLKNNPTIEFRKYIFQEINNGKLLIQSIEKRKRTIIKVVSRIFELQKDFLNHGMSHLRPLSIKKVAKYLKLHETTIGRAISNKYIRTPYGILKLNYFFNYGYRNNGSLLISSSAIKERIAEIIKNENLLSSVSDQKIAIILMNDGISIHRRTVCKYRQSLGIPSSGIRNHFL